MKIELSGAFAGKVKKLELSPYNDGTIRLSLEWQDRNSCNDGNATYSESIIVDMSQLKKVMELL